MSLSEFVRKQFIDILQWAEEDDEVLAWRFPVADAEIQQGAQLVVRETQAALFVNEGRAADLFGPGRHPIRTRNLPLLTDLLHWDKLFESPFKSDVHFFSTRLRVGQRWGTQAAMTVRDREFGAVRLRAFGVHAFRIAEPRTFFQKVSGTRALYGVADLEAQLRGTIVSTLTDHLGQSGLPFLDLAANLQALSAQVGGRLAEPFGQLGLAVEGFQVESVSLPDELQARLDERIGMGMAGDLDRYTRFQTARAIPTAAAAEGGVAGAGAGLGAGMAMGQAMARALSPSGPTGPEAAPAAAPTGAPVAAACGRCGHAWPAAARFCPECGTART
jgi:membrane protease subunit (stomatin/prohibitin family)